MALVGLSTYCSEPNAPGLLEIKYLPTAWIDQSAYLKLINPPWNWQQSIPLAQGDWLTAYGLPTGQKWTEPHRRSDQGKTYNQKVTAVIPNLKSSVAQEFDEMDEYAYLLKVKLRDGGAWLIGTLSYPLRFFADGESGQVGSGFKGHLIRFEGPTINKAYTYQPAF